MYGRMCVMWGRKRVKVQKVYDTFAIDFRGLIEREIEEIWFGAKQFNTISRWLEKLAQIWQTVM